MLTNNEPTKGTVLLISGLGNGTESFNWNLSTSDMREKTKLPITQSLQKQITDLGYETISFDPPGYKTNADLPIPSNTTEYCKQIHDFAGNVQN
jgi:hypothetical protein